MKNIKIGRILAFVGLVLVAINSYGQSYAFRVLANKGTSEVKSSDGWQPLKTGMSLKAGDELKVAENSYVGLVSVEGKPVELKKPGPYKVSELAEQVKGGASVMTKYVDFILSSNSAEAKKNRLSATGAVHRGEPTLLSVFLPPPQNASIFGTSMVVRWEAPKAGGPYTVTLKNIFEEDLAKFETPETNIRIDLTDPKLSSETAFLVEVASKADPKTKSDGKVVKKLSAADLARVQKSYAEIAGEVKDQTALDKFVQAGFYEQNGLLIDALTCYEDAIRLAPDIDTYRDARDEFLYRNKLATPKQ